MNFRKNMGISLVEVMIALLVFSVGLLGISQLQTNLIQNSSNANQRTVAVSIAQQKIDDLRSYSLLTSTTTWAAETIPASGIAFTHINDNTGGSPQGSSDLRSDQVITRANTDYTLSWAVQDYTHTAALSAPDASTPASGYPDMKAVTVIVSWVDFDGTDASVALNTIIDSYPPTATALSDNASIGDEGPQANYTPELAPDVIDVEVDAGDGTNRQTSKPLPDAVKTGADSNTLVTFDVMTYYRNAADETISRRQEEFQTVDCECQFDRNDGFGFPPAHVVWDETTEERYDYIELDATTGLAKSITKPIAAQVNNANDVDELCEMCCRDHHDSGTGPKYVPGTADYVDHTHYQADGTEANRNSRDNYIESCRFKRVDGILRVFQDWKLYDITTMDRAALATVAASGGIQDTYSNYVEDYVLNTVGVSSAVPVKPDAVTDISSTVGAGQQLEVRGIYLDQVYDLEGNENPSAYTDYVFDASNADRLEKIPFSEVNLSLLSNWSSADNTKVTVTDEDVATIADPVNDYYGTYSRGYISALAETASVAITAEIATNNNGITQLVHPSNVSISDDITVEVGPSAGNFDITGTYTFSFPNGDSSVDRVTVVESGGATCTTPSGNSIICNVASPWSGTIDVTVKVNGNQSCEGTASYTAYGIASDPSFSITGTCN